MSTYLDSMLLATMVRNQRGMLGLREVAALLGDVSPATLSRVENEQPVDLTTFLRLCDWLRVPPAEFLRSTDDPAPPFGTVRAIELHLLADPHLDPAGARALVDVVRAAYPNLRRQE